jgi:uncharacterized RDD family membrane protein YckC
MTDAPGDERGLWGHYAGAVSRFVAYVVDCGTSTGIFMLVLATASFAASILVGHPINWSKGDVWVAIAFAAWQFVYYAYSWAANGKTFGMALLGVQVVSREGVKAGPRRAVVRTLAFPLSFLLCGLGFAGILLGRERRALHDVIAGTAVVYTWHARAQRLRFLARSGEPRISAQPDSHVPLAVPAQPEFADTPAAAQAKAPGTPAAAQAKAPGTPAAAQAAVPPDAPVPAEATAESTVPAQPAPPEGDDRRPAGPVTPSARSG